MPKGRQATGAFRATKAARFAEMRARSEAKKDAERDAGTRRRPFWTTTDEVREDDQVAKKGGGYTEDGTNPEEWETVEDGDQTVVFVRGFDPDNTRGMF